MPYRLIWTLIPVSAIYGLVAALVFLRFSDQASVRRTVNRIMAHVLELRLFFDSPALVLRAQRDLLRENLRLLRLVLLPGVILAVIFAILFPRMDAMYGHGPLRMGERSVVTARLSPGQSPALVLEVPAGIEVETPPVYAVHDHEVSWLVRPLGRTSGEMKVRYNGRALPDKIEVRYPRTTVLGVNWMVWFFVISTAAAIGYRR